jgi:hypothetical protein
MTFIDHRTASNMKVCPVPEMLNPLGRYWEQPNPAKLEFDDESVMMTRSQFNGLHNYSASKPTGAYPGKMWKWSRRENNRSDKVPDDWYLCWYGPLYTHTDNREYMDTFTRLILVVD